jgi:anti-sigma regulatory factor (Ser/Thr protein kinase)
MNPFDDADTQAATNPLPDTSSAATDGPTRPSQEDPCSLTGGHDLIVQLVQPRTPASVRAVRHLVGEALSALAVDYTCRVDIEIALGEVCTNAVLHAGGTGYRVAVRLKDNDCVIEVVDDGIGIDPRCFARRSRDNFASRSGAISGGRTGRRTGDQTSQADRHRGPHGQTARPSRADQLIRSPRADELDVGLAGVLIVGRQRPIHAEDGQHPKHTAPRVDHREPHLLPVGQIPGHHQGPCAK